MAIVTIPKKDFEKEIGKFDAEMQEKIALFGTPIEAITENEFSLEIFPNRPDMLSYSGFKRAFLAYLGKKTGLKKYSINPPEKDYEVIIDSSVKEIRPYTVCAVVKGLKFDDFRIKELVEIQEKLHLTLGRKRKKIAIGVYPLDRIKFPIIFKAMEPDQIKFIPLEMSRELSGLEILQRHPAGKEYAHLLAGKAKFPVFIDANNQILSMPPIINSQLTGKVTSETKEIFIECSGFDFDALKFCLNIIVTSLAEMSGKIYQVNLKYSKKEVTPNLISTKMRISLENVNKILGLNLKEKEIKRLLERMGHNYVKGGVEIAAWRTDILHEVDIIEDIAIAYGYENFIPEIPEISAIGEEDKKIQIKRKFSEILCGISMLEVLNYHLTSKKNQIERMGLSSKNEEVIEIEGSKTEYDILRSNLIHLLLKNFSENVDAEYPQEIFEIGRVFYLDKFEKKIKEKEVLAAGISPGNFTRIKQILDYFFRSIDKEISFKEAEKIPPYFIEGRTAEILFKNKKIGYLGEIHPRILKNWRMKMPIALFEIEIDEIMDELI